jgi:sugar/nucleoside kinase (ribokinase family)
MEANQIVFMGGCFRDLVACSPRFPKVGETIVGSKFHMGFGGKAANAAVMCARLGGQVSIISKLGNDGNGVAYRDAFQTEGIDTLHLYTDPNEPSGKIFSRIITQKIIHVHVFLGESVIWGKNPINWMSSIALGVWARTLR